jgi:glyoxylase-like metal-dependent hydrolase (beta-lactamase superfamily II)
MRLGSRSGKGGLLRRGHMVCHCLLLETDDGLALVDTGLGTEDMANPGKRLGRAFVAMTGLVARQEDTALAQVERLGFQRSDVRHILVTHLDLDHAGGLADFPDATVHVHRLEQEAAFNRPTRLERERYRSVQWAHQPRWQTHTTDGERWYGFESVRAVPGSRDEILLVPLVGHSRGHSGIAVKTDTGWLLHAGDAYFAHNEIHRTPPRCPPMLDVFQRIVQVDGEARLANQARLRTLVTAYSEVQVICAHDESELRTLQAGK